MSRYIDADAFDDIVQTLNEQGWNITRFDYKRMDRVLFEMPTADVVEVVRCKDCIHHKKFFGRNEYYCDVFDWHSRRMDYCSFGERREG